MLAASSNEYPIGMRSFATDGTADTRPFRLTLSRWPSAAARRVQAWQQTSRRQHNLVLHVNFAGSHNDLYARIFGRENNQAFAISSHPAELTPVAGTWFLVEVIGIRRIFSHKFESSLFYKQMHAAPRPRSLYTDLPTRFCFQVQDVKPEMLTEHRGIRRQLKRTRMQAARFHLLDLNAPVV